MSLSDQLDQEDKFADAWRPNPGDKLVGKIVAFGRRNGYDDVPYTIITVQKEDGSQLAVHAFHYVLAEELKKYKLRQGVEIGIKFLGKPEGKNYAAYKVVSNAEIAQETADPQYEAPVSDVTPQGAVSAFQPAASGGDDDIPF